MDNKLGAVVIGRNEGKRLKRCLKSVLRQTDNIVYVDSGSSDGSVEYAESIGVNTVQLDMSIPFSAARARNEGFQYLSAHFPSLIYIHFIDGDCELCTGWFEQAISYLDTNHSCAIITGHLQERFPEKSVYNTLCDIEWDAPPGNIKSCGGIFTIRKNSFNEVQGFNPAVMAGEEPDLCYRLRNKSWKVHRIDCLMAIHDADMIRFSQWWKRSVRSGHAYALGYFLHRNNVGTFYMAECIRIWFWALIFPTVIFLCTFFLSKWWLLGLVGYLLQFAKIFLASRSKEMSLKKSLLYSIFMVIIKFPQMVGQLTYLLERFTKTHPAITESS